MTDAPPAPRRTDARALLVWGVGVAAYGCGVIQRTSFGVAGLDAAHRFGAPAGVVSTFVVVQLLVYAGLQVPAGVLIDRFGSRRMLATGLVVMALGQVSMAFAAALPSGIIARVLVGAGDSVMFAGVIRLVPSWFPPERVPVFTQLTGILGQLGQIGSAVPFAWLLHTRGWEPAFLAAAAACLAFLVAVPLAVRDRPAGVPKPRADEEDEAAGLLRQVALAWRSPSTRLGLWVHYAAGFPSMVFAMMWGYPFLTSGEGVAPPVASALLSLFVLASIPFGPTLGNLTRRHPLRRSNIALALVLLNLLPWLVVLLWPGPAPLWLLVVLVVGMALAGPGSNIGFDMARTGNPSHRLATANGMVIVGGFGGALVAVLLVGFVLDAVAAGGPYGLTAFRAGMATQVPLLLLGLVQILRARRVSRAALAREEGVVVRPLREVLRERRRRRDA